MRPEEACRDRTSQPGAVGGGCPNLVPFWAEKIPEGEGGYTTTLLAGFSGAEGVMREYLCRGPGKPGNRPGQAGVRG